MANAIWNMRIGLRGSSNPAVVRAMERSEIPYPPGNLLWHRVDVHFGVGDFVPAAAVAQTLDLNVIYPHLAFPADVLREPGSFARVKVGLGGTAVATATVEIGDAGDTNGLMTAQSAFGGVARILPSTPAAAENEQRTEVAFAPVLRVVLTGANMTALTGRVVVFIPFRRLVP